MYRRILRNGLNFDFWEKKKNENLWEKKKDERKTSEKKKINEHCNDFFDRNSKCIWMSSKEKKSFVVKFDCNHKKWQ